MRHRQVFFITIQRRALSGTPSQRSQRLCDAFGQRASFFPHRANFTARTSQLRRSAASTSGARPPDFAALIRLIRAMIKV
jgi:hypothetical protein